MSYTVDVLYTKNADLSNPTTVTESGQPASVNLTGLDANEVYYTKAVLKNDGVTEDESNIEQFQTLQAGTITLTHQSTERSGSNYVIKFTYTSTYALSSATINCGTAISAQGTIAGSVITFTFPATNLVDGHSYICTVNAIDIYTEQASVNYGFTHHKLYQLAITGTTATSSTVECELDYIIDGTFTEGYVEWWNGTDDPSTDQPLGHEYFNDGADTCTISGLTEGTTYKFRATIYYDGNVNFVQSTVVTATTVVDYDSKYFSIKNNGSNNLNVWIRTEYGLEDETLYYSTDDCVTWNTVTMQSNTLKKITTLAPDAEVFCKHTGALYGRNFSLSCNNGFTFVQLRGNIASLCCGDNFTGTQTMPENAFRGLFGTYSDITDITGIYAGQVRFSSFTAISNHGVDAMFNGCANLFYAPNFSTITTIGESGMMNTFNGAGALQTPPRFGSLTTVRTNGMWAAFRDCIHLTTPPDLSTVTNISEPNAFNRMFVGCKRLATPPDLSGITSVGSAGMEMMFDGCTALTTPPDFSNITTISHWGTRYMFEGCTALTTPPDLSNVTSIQTYAFEKMFNGCTALTTPPTLNSAITAIPEGGMKQMFQGCTNLRSVPDLSNVTSVGAEGMRSMFDDCRTITDPADLSNVTSVGDNGLSYAFMNCVALESGPDISNVTSVGTYGLRRMLFDCRSLTEAYAPDITWDTSISDDWMSGVAASGTLYCPSENVFDTMSTGISGCPTGWTKQLIS